MRLTTSVAWYGLIALSALATVGCGGDPEIVEGTGRAGNGGTTNNGGAGPIGGGFNPGGGSGGQAGTGNEGPCALQPCGVGQRCEVKDDAATCVDNTCDDLNCTDLQECAPAEGGGFYCKNIGCSSDVQCPPARFCDGTKCVDDVCEPGTQRCAGDDVFICTSNGGEDKKRFTCDGPAYYESECTDTAVGSGCTCEDDWDCPAYTTCETGRCVGTGVAPTCTLPPVPFEQVLPQREFHWGGTSTSSTAATGSPWPNSAQSASVPVVINLDDDNGDGFVNELDFPEIVFMTYQTSVDTNGVVRAIHGGGPNKGKDYFALCGTTHWAEGQLPVPAGECADSAANARGSGAVAAGDLDGDGLPEIVVPLETGTFQILNNKGQIIFTGAAGIWPSSSGANDWRYPAVSIANVDFDGLAEIIVGNRVVKLKKDAGAFAVDRVFAGQFRTGTSHHTGDVLHHGPIVCPADLISANAGLEIVAGTSAYRLPTPVPNCTGANATTDYCLNRLTLLWDAQAVNGTTAIPHTADDQRAEGFCAVADVLGATTTAAPGPGNPLDGTPEVVVISDGYLLVLNGATGQLLRNLPLGGGRQGGAPNIDDFDGDGFPEIATALSDFYRVIDLQDPQATNCPAWPAVIGKTADSPGTNPARNPGGACTQDSDCNAGAVCNETAGTCTCLHNGWFRNTEDNSSKVTSSSVFDFNGDGAAEVVYNDECYFRAYDGASGKIHLAIPSLSRTIVENPVVADVDNDGNAEILFVQNNELLREVGGTFYPQCDETLLLRWPTLVRDVNPFTLGNGIDVWGDPSDVWVAARRVWNQHSYHVTNITEGGSVPLHEPESWRPYNGRLYNTYRSQPRNYGVAPDLALTAIQVSSPNTACGQLSNTIQIVVEVKNLGDLRVGPGVLLQLSGSWTNPGLNEALKNPDGTPLTATLQASLEPGASTLVTFDYVATSNTPGTLPDAVKAVIDGNDTQRECRENNNEIEGPVQAGASLADLRLVIDSAIGCLPPEVNVTVHNDGSVAAENVLVRIYAGDPSQGGTSIGETTIAGPIAPGASATAEFNLDSLDRNVTLYGIVDPLDAIQECNNANNRVMGPGLNCKRIE